MNNKPASRSIIKLLYFLPPPLLLLILNFFYCCKNKLDQDSRKSLFNSPSRSSLYLFILILLSTKRQTSQDWTFRFDIDYLLSIRHRLSALRCVYSQRRIRVFGPPRMRTKGSTTAFEWNSNNPALYACPPSHSTHVWWLNHELVRTITIDTNTISLQMISNILF